MLFTNRNTPKKPNVISASNNKDTTNMNSSTGSGGKLVYEVKVDKRKRRYPKENIGIHPQNYSSTAHTKSPIVFGLRKDAVMNFVHIDLPKPVQKLPIKTTKKRKENTITNVVKTPVSTDPIEIKKWIEQCIHAKVAKLSTPKEVSEIVEKSLLQKIPKQLTLEEIQKEIQQKIPKQLTLEEIQKEIQQKIPKQLTLEEIQKEIHKNDSLVDSKIKGIQNEIQQKIPKQLTLEEIQNEIHKNDSLVDSKIKEIQNGLNSLADPNSIIESYVNSKLQELPNKTTVEELVNTYLEKTIDEASIVETTEDENEDDTCAKTKFEQLIEPAVARIVQRILKYDYSDKEYFTPDDDTKSVNLDIQYDEVYDYENQENGHFQAPSVEYKIKAPENAKPRPSILNPMLSSTLGVPTDSPDLTMDVVYKKEEPILYENELRSEFRSSRKWIRMGSGIEKGSVLDICMDRSNRRVYIVGHFKHVNRVAMENIAVYDMNIKGWHHVGDGIPGLATCITIYESSQILFVGGLFTKVGKGENQIAANNIAAYYILQKKWVNLGEGLNRECSTLYFDEENEKLYAGGSFTHSGDQKLNYVGIYDLATNQWTALYNGEINGPCRTVMKIDQDLYLGGLFTHAGTSDCHVSYVTKYDLSTNTWTSLAGGLQGYCNALAYDPEEKAVYVGGTFTSVGDRTNSQDAHHIAKFYVDHQKWDTMLGGVNNVVNSLYFDTTHKCLYVGGNFTSTFENTTVVNRIAIYTPYTQKWNPLPNHFPHCKISQEDDGSDNVGLNGVCKVLSLDKKSLFIAGSFQIAGNITANSIVRYVVHR